jgi:hypothetical protein
MSKSRFTVTYEIVTPQSAAHGEADERGYVDDHGCTDTKPLPLTLRDALKAFRGTRTNRVDGVECTELDSSPCVRPRWITVCNGMEFETGAHESRSLHIPGTVTNSSARRIARLTGVRL